MRNGSGDITTNLAEIKMIVKEYYDKLYTKTLDNLDKIIKFVQIHKLQEEIESLNRCIVSEETESVIKNFHHRKVQNQIASLVNVFKCMKEN